MRIVGVCIAWWWRGLMEGRASGVMAGWVMSHEFRVHYISLFLVYLSVPKRRRHDSRGVLLVVLLLLQSSHVLPLHLASPFQSFQNLYLFTLKFDTHPRNNYPCPPIVSRNRPSHHPLPTSALPTSSQTNPQQTHFSPKTPRLAGFFSILHVGSADADNSLEGSRPQSPTGSTNVQDSTVCAWQG